MKKIFLFLVLSIFFFSCNDDENTINKIDDIIFPSSNISYYRHIQPLFDIGCAIQGCHDNTTKANGLELSSYYNVRYGKLGVVIPNDTINSRLLQRLEGRNGLPPMPPSRALNANQLQGFRQWIMEGATDTIK